MVSYERTGAAALVTIDRPERRNAVDGPTAAKLLEAYEPPPLARFVRARLA